jgi:hypothetical protein
VYLFDDFADVIEVYPTKKGLRDRWMFNGEIPSPPKSTLKEYPKAKLYYPTENRCKNTSVKWHKYGQEESSITLPRYDILIHARNLKPTPWYDKKVVKGSRNWPTEKWEKLISVLRDYSIASVGTKTGSRHIEGTVDLRDIPLVDLCRHMANTNCVMGESSGPMHLAALCGAKAVVWTHRHKEKSLGGKTNRWRLEKGWNPFRSTVEHRFLCPTQILGRSCKQWGVSNHCKSL